MTLLVKNIQKNIKTRHIDHETKIIMATNTNTTTAINQYITRLNQAHIVRPQSITVPWQANPLVLNCISIDLNNKPTGFTCSTTSAADLSWDVLSWQYDLRNLSKGRPKAYRVPFLNDPNFESANYTVSHLCHNNWCHNPAHHALETLADNKGRNGCTGGPYCSHLIRCLIPGPYYRGLSASTYVQNTFGM